MARSMWSFKCTISVTSSEVAKLSSVMKKCPAEVSDFLGCYGISTGK
jgi:hypothetical protein